jgi:hypothetical protein
MAGTRHNRWVSAVGAVAVLVGAQVVVAVVGAAPAGAALTGVTMVVSTSGYYSDDLNEVTTYCPSGKVVLGGGGRVIDGDGYVMIKSMTPGANGFRVHAQEIASGYGGAWALRVYAICSDPVAGSEFVQRSEWSPSGAKEHQVTVSCSAGRKVLGTGAFITTGVDASLQWIRPYDQNGTGSMVVSVVGDGVNRFGVTAWGICAPAPTGYEINATGTAGYTGRVLQVSTRCTGVRKVLSTGLTKVDSNGTSRVDGIFPTSDLSTVWTVSRQPVASNTIHLGAWAICAD